MTEETRKERQWLQRFVGDWTFEVEGTAEEGKPAEKHPGTETGRSLDGVWVILEGESEMPGAGPIRSIMTLGFDETKGRYVGTYVASMMTYLWVYEGDLDAAGNVLTLETTGPSFTDEGKMARYRDVIEFRSDDHRVMTSVTQGEDGQWTTVMEANYRRVTQAGS
jgi:hypothetical protein